MPATLLGTTVFGVVFWFVAPIVVRALGHQPRRIAKLWLVAAIVAVAISWDLPSPFFSDHTATFTQHAVGGGVASVFVAYFFLHHVDKTTVMTRALAVLAVVSVLGVLNELLELLLDEIRGTRLAADASWDLFGNTTGAALSFVLLETSTGVLRSARSDEFRQV